VHGGQLAAAWGTRETFVAILTTNLPMIFPLLKAWLMPILPWISRSTDVKIDYETPRSGFVTFGGGSGGATSHHARKITPRMVPHNESEEYIFHTDGDIHLKSKDGLGGSGRSTHTIVVSKWFSITTEDCLRTPSVELFERE
jgi:hypothetical protein